MRSKERLPLQALIRRIGKEEGWVRGSARGQLRHHDLVGNIVERICGEDEPMEVGQNGERLLCHRINRDQPDCISNDYSIGVIGQLHFQSGAAIDEHAQALPGATSKSWPAWSHTLVDADGLARGDARPTTARPTARPTGIQLLDHDGEMSVAGVRVTGGPGELNIISAGGEVGKLPGGLSRSGVSISSVEAVVAIKGAGDRREIALPA